MRRLKALPIPLETNIYIDVLHAEYLFTTRRVESKVSGLEAPKVSKGFPNVNTSLA
jgi:hypothetical protein